MKYGWIAVAVLVAGAASASAENGKAVLRGTADGSAITGIAKVTPTANGITVSVKVEHAPPGKHGFHIHQFGVCDDGGKAAGGHYNPKGVPHGLVTKDGLTGAHAGDFGNLEVGPDGNGSLEVTVPGVSLTGGQYSVAGRAVVLHELPDDFGQPTGNAGGRIACGPIVLVE